MHTTPGGTRPAQSIWVTQVPHCIVRYTWANLLDGDSDRPCQFYWALRVWLTLPCLFVLWLPLQLGGRRLCAPVNPESQRQAGGLGQHWCPAAAGDCRHHCGGHVASLAL